MTESLTASSQKQWFFWVNNLKEQTETGGHEWREKLLSEQVTRAKKGAVKQNSTQQSRSGSRDINKRTDLESQEQGHLPRVVVMVAWRNAVGN